MRWAIILYSTVCSVSGRPQPYALSALCNRLIGKPGKMVIMQAMDVPDKDVQKAALLATQHVMVNGFK